MITSWRWNDAGLAQDEDGLKEAEMALGWSWSQDHKLALEWRWIQVHKLALEWRWDGDGAEITSLR